MIGMTRIRGLIARKSSAVYRRVAHQSLRTIGKAFKRTNPRGDEAVATGRNRTVRS